MLLIDAYTLIECIANGLLLLQLQINRNNRELLNSLLCTNIVCRIDVKGK